jgi:hypothetical protein
MTPEEKRNRIQEVYQQKKKETEITMLNRIIAEKDKRILELEAEVKVLMKMLHGKI